MNPLLLPPPYSPRIPPPITFQVYSSHHPPGVIRSAQAPEETRGLTRSGDLSRMLPLEAHLLAAGWPRRGGSAQGAAAVVDDRVSSRGSSEQGAGGEREGDGGGRSAGGSLACRRLFMARRAERQLLSYERAG